MTAPVFNQWFLGLSYERQAVLREDKWMLAEAAYNSAQSEIARLTAERDAALAGVVMVKPLVWFEVELPSRGGGKYTAEGYTVRRIEGVWLLDFSGQSRSDWRFGSADLAKAAAQADYETRILAALEPQPITVQDAARVLLDAHAAVCAKGWKDCTEAERDIFIMEVPALRAIAKQEGR